MDKAKAAVSDFMHKSGKHDTSVDETINPAVVHENVTPTRHENVTTAVDKEVHQDHYHTSVQPIKDREVLPEKHSHNIVGVEERKFDHGDVRQDQDRLAREAAQFKDERSVNETQHTHSVAPAIAGEHVHHHVHEQIQPVVQKETIQPNVVHTTVPVHEVHQNAAQHHTTSALPPVTMSDFKAQGGVLTGREARHDGFEGEPRSVGGALSGGSSNIARTDNTTTGTHSTLGSTGTGTHSTTDSSAMGTQSTTDSTGAGKPSMMEKMNPKKDADGDGKAGFMK